MGLVDLVNRAKELLEPEEGKCLWCNGNADTGHDPCCEAACWLADAAAPSAKVLKVQIHRWGCVNRPPDEPIWKWSTYLGGVEVWGEVDWDTQSECEAAARRVAAELGMGIEVVE